ncbi:RhoGAP-domain-containing protein [Gonapodya prolifera JEL478]|uniref:RhoGAP-domain-containing protein n=1 Tax=Gonapodya prolifera (strain JEL478) TaxID=1344416 RepID=A0A139AS54_GONPJ|nr:RhoGAP-domain-containing protein [Gonapodya prolifera JEL478]|eukprot:KXS19586.1 RhoGAP-domain-containing protein [Gonapodya prolifera JEL478]
MDRTLLFSIPEEEEDEEEAHRAEDRPPPPTETQCVKNGIGDGTPFTNVNRAFWDFVRRRRDALSDNDAPLEVVGVCDEGGNLWLLSDPHRRRSASPQPTLSSLSLTSLASLALLEEGEGEEEGLLVPASPSALADFEDTLQLHLGDSNEVLGDAYTGKMSRLDSSGSTITPPSLISRSSTPTERSLPRIPISAKRGSPITIGHSRSISAPSLSAYLRVPLGTYLEFDRKTGWWILLRTHQDDQSGKLEPYMLSVSASAAAEGADGLRAIRSVGTKMMVNLASTNLTPLTIPTPTDKKPRRNRENSTRQPLRSAALPTAAASQSGHARSPSVPRLRSHPSQTSLGSQESSPIAVTVVPEYTNAVLADLPQASKIARGDTPSDFEGPFESSLNASTSNLTSAISTFEDGKGTNTDWVCGELADVEGGMQIMWERVKQDVESARVFTTFLQERVKLEKAYGEGLTNLTRNLLKQTDKDATALKDGSYNENWKQFLQLHEAIGVKRTSFSRVLQQNLDEMKALCDGAEMSRKQLKKSAKDAQDEMSKSAKECEKLHHNLTEWSQKYELAQVQADQAQRDYGFNVAASSSSNGGGMKGLGGLFSKQPPLTRAIELAGEAERKAQRFNTEFNHQLGQYHKRRDEFANHTAPRIVRALKEENDQLDARLKVQLAKYALSFEDAIVADATMISPMEDGASLRRIIDEINLDEDFQRYLTRTVRDVRASQPSYLNLKRKSEIFGVPLHDILQREGTPVPMIVQKCVETIEKRGLNEIGIYRLAAPLSHVHKLRNLAEADLERMNFESEANAPDGISAIASLLKLYFRELPDGLFPRNMYDTFIRAAKIEDLVLQQNQIHQAVNMLPDESYIVLRYLVAHLERVIERSGVNKMTAYPLSIVWGPNLISNASPATAAATLPKSQDKRFTLMRATSTPDLSGAQQVAAASHAAAESMKHECKVIEECPAFAKGCPYSEGATTDIAKLKECPAFSSGCPFTKTSDPAEIQKLLSHIPQMHPGLMDVVDLHKGRCPDPTGQHVQEQLLAHYAGNNHSDIDALEKKCPAFASGCPYSKGDWAGAKLKADACPAFKDNACPFAHKTADQIKALIATIPESHGHCPVMTDDFNKCVDPAGHDIVGTLVSKFGAKKE